MLTLFNVPCLRHVDLRKPFCKKSDKTSYEQCGDNGSNADRSDPSHENDFQKGGDHYPGNVPDDLDI